MYRIMIVDDEEWIRKGILSKLDYFGFAFEWIGEAGDGQEALKLFMQYHPEMIIVDISMPGMNGIDMVSQIMTIDSNTKVIIISGYAEFNYAKKAISMGVCDYLLKPIDDQKLVHLLKSIILTLDEQMKIKDIVNKVEGLELEYTLIHSEREINQIFHSPQSYDNQDPSFLLKDAQHRYLLVILHVVSDDSECQKEDHVAFTKEKIKTALAPLDLSGRVLIIDNYHDMHDLMILIRLDEQVDTGHCNEEIASAIYQTVKTELGIRISLSVSSIHSGISNRLYRQAKAAYEMRMIDNNNMIYLHDNLIKFRKNTYPNAKFKILQQCMETGDFKSIRATLKDIFMINNEQTLSLFYLHIAFYDTVKILIDVYSRSGISPNKYIAISSSTSDAIERFNCVKDLVDFLYDTIVDALKPYFDNNCKCINIVENIRAYINQNYNSELLVGDIAVQHAINANYLSTIFKKATGCSVNRYIIKVRIDKACYYLRETDLSIAEVSSLVGYHDPQYFYRVFKKILGLTAFEYRVTYRRSDECRDMRLLFPPFKKMNELPHKQIIQGDGAQTEQRADPPELPLSSLQ